MKPGAFETLKWWQFEKWQKITFCMIRSVFSYPITVSEILVETLNIVLKNYVIEFNGDFFLQLQGMAMGTKMTPAYTIGSNETTLQSIDRENIHIWKRYIDGIFVIWLGAIKQLTTCNIPNQPSTPHHYKHSNSELTFLDVIVYKGPQFNDTGLLDVKTHIKYF